MRSVFLVTGLILGFALPSQARIGETLDQCKERYGPVIEQRQALLKQSDGVACVFSKGGISVIVEFRAGIAWNVQYRTLDLVASQVNDLLKANMPMGGSWSAAYIVSGVQYRLSGDRRRTSMFHPGLAGEVGILEISTREFNNARWEMRSAQFMDPDGGAKSPGAKALDGF